MPMYKPNITNEFSFILRPSTVPGCGIGVFTTHIINKDVRVQTAPGRWEFRWLKKSEIPDVFLPYCIAGKNDLYQCPNYFNRMEIGWYINHSFEPNVIKKGDGIYTNKIIQAGEEIFIDYNILNEPEDKKESYYIPIPP